MAPKTAPIYAPVNASKNMTPLSPVTIAIAAPNAAPELIPSTDGSAIGFLKTPCITQPTEAKAPPISIAVSVLGTLILPMIVSVVLASSSPLPVKYLITSERVISELPRQHETAITQISMMAAIVNLITNLSDELLCSRMCDSIRIQCVLVESSYSLNITRSYSLEDVGINCKNSAFLNCCELCVRLSLEE